MKALLSALVLSAASVLPVSAGIHDFNPENARPVSPAPSSVVGKCVTMQDNSHLCWQQFNDVFTIAINDVDYPGLAQSVVMRCDSGRWTAWGPLSKETLEWYMEDFCTSFN